MKHSSENAERITKWGIRLYCYSLAFTKLLELPVTGDKFQLSELIFLFLLLPLTIFEFSKNGYSLARLGRVDYFPLVLVIPLLPSLFFSWNAPTIFELLGLIYLLAVYCSFRYLLPAIGDVEDFLLSTIQQMGIICLITIAYSYFSLIWPQLDPAGLGLYESKYIPILGWIYRAEGFSGTPNMLASLLILPTIVQWKIWFTHPFRFKDAGLALLFSIAFLATGSKSLILLTAGIIGISLPHTSDYRLRYLLKIGIAGSIIFYLFSTNFLLSPKGENTISQQTYTSGHILWENQQIALYETTHFKLKQIAWKAFLENPMFGIGLGNYPQYLKAQQTAGNYPAQLPIYRPHSTYMKFLAETGISGLLVWLSLILFFLIRSYQGSQVPLSKRQVLLFGLFLSYGIWLLDATAVDILNFRHFWVSLAMLNVLLYIREHENKLG